ncbi:hypothetical protein AB0M68_01830 [Streptomyces sp. NPDC051453]|uniref:hypothetical protein n=1 Tax=Streptomyces sp. NPDC051453 TaxID=3154941 RepID=UPI00341F21EB
MAGQGKKTAFDGMTHEQMLAWLDQADAGTVQAAADKLASAAKEIHSIAEELKIRPQWVKWKGEGADSFRLWAGKLANTTVALGDYSQDSSKWLGHAAEAIGKAKTSVPRDKNVDANIDAARSAHNDPDSQTILSKNMAVRQQTADEMEKLGQAYSLSTSQMAAAKKPEQLKFPPPPADIQDPDRAKLDGGGYRQRPGGGAQGTTGGQTFASSGAHGGASAAGHATAEGSAGADHGALGTAPLPAAHGSVTPPARMDVDSVGVLPETSHTPSQTTSGPSVGPNPVSPGPTGNPAPGLIPPVAYGKGVGRGTGPAIGSARGLSPTAGTGGTQRPVSPTASGATGRPSNTGGRGPMMPGQNQPATGRAGAPGRLPTTNGVGGGRPQPATGKPATGIPRGKVMGSESATGGRGSTTGQGPVGGRPSTPGTGPRSGGASRRVGGATGDNGGIVGGRAQQQGRSNVRSFSSGGSGLVRGQGGSNGASSDESLRSGQTGRNGATPRGSRPESPRDENQSERPDYVTEDEQTWTPDDRRNVPSVVDDPTKNSER